MNVPQQPTQPDSPVINMISGGSMHVMRRNLPKRKVKPYPTILVSDVPFERKRLRADDVISFSDKDQ